VQSLSPLAIPNTPGAFSAVLDLAALSATAEITFAVPGAGPLDQVQVYFTTHASATNAASAVQGPLLTGPTPGPWQPEIPARYVIVERIAGPTTGLLLEATGQETPSAGSPSTSTLSGASLAIANLPTGGNIGTASATVDAYIFFTLDQTTPAVTVTLPNPTVTGSARLAVLTHTGTAAFLLYGAAILPGSSALLVWTGTQWQLAGLGGAASVVGNQIGSAITIGPNDSNALVFITNGTSAFKIDPNQNVGIGPGMGLATPKARLDLNGAFLIEPVTTSDKPTGGSVGSAATTVDVTSILHLAQVTAGQALTLPPPTNATAPGRLLIAINVGTVPVLIGDATLQQNVNLMPGAATSKGQGCVFEWDGTAWVPISAFLATPAQGANLGDASVTLTRAGQFSQYTMPAGTLSTGRTVTLPSAAQGAQPGDVALVSRLDVSANTLTIANGGPGAGNLFVMPVSKVNSLMARFDGTNWQFMFGGAQ
jgi:hypothetical protein